MAHCSKLTDRISLFVIIAVSGCGKGLGREYNFALLQYLALHRVCSRDSWVIFVKLLTYVPVFDVGKALTAVGAGEASLDHFLNRREKIVEIDEVRLNPTERVA